MHAAGHHCWRSARAAAPCARPRAPGDRRGNRSDTRSAAAATAGAAPRGYGSHYGAVPGGLAVLLPAGQVHRSALAHRRDDGKHRSSVCGEGEMATARGRIRPVRRPQRLYRPSRARLGELRSPAAKQKPDRLLRERLRWSACSVGSSRRIRSPASATTAVNIAFPSSRTMCGRPLQKAWRSNWAALREYLAHRRAASRQRSRHRSNSPGDWPI